MQNCAVLRAAMVDIGTLRFFLMLAFVEKTVCIDSALKIIINKQKKP